MEFAIKQQAKDEFGHVSDFCHSLEGTLNAEFSFIEGVCQQFAGKTLLFNFLLDFLSTQVAEDVELITEIDKNYQEMYKCRQTLNKLGKKSGDKLQD